MKAWYLISPLDIDSLVDEEALFGMDLYVGPKILMDFSMGFRFTPVEIEDLFYFGILLPIGEKGGFQLEKKTF